MKRFSQNDVFNNVIELFPSNKFLIYDGAIYRNDEKALTGSHGNSLNHVPSGYLNLYELNVDREQDSLIYPFITKEGSKNAFKSVSLEEFQSYQFGDIISGSYPLSSSLGVEYYPIGSERNDFHSLRNTLESYRKLSPYYAFSSSLGDKSTQQLTVVNIPNIFYGSSIKKGTVGITYYTTGSVEETYEDTKKNGELVKSNGDVEGVVLYNEGFVLLWGDASEDLMNMADTSSFALEFSGSMKIPTITMMCHADRGEFNHSQNPTYIEYGQNDMPATSSQDYIEKNDLTIKNVVQSPYNEYDEAFEKITYISSVGIYDKDKNLIAIGKLARPLRKRTRDNYTIKFRIDI
jgi:hypothetical protein